MSLNQIKLYAINYGHCDPKKCSCLKLRRFNLIKIVRNVKNLHRKTIILTPFAEKTIDSDDKDIIKTYGLAVIDCSWNKSKYILKKRFRTGRKLPRLLAANPVNYGKWEKLSSVEALAGALILTGFSNVADNLLSKFSWGFSFIDINEIFDRFQDAERGI